LSLIGLIESTPNRKPELVFVARSQLNYDDILWRASEAQDAVEYTGIHMISNEIKDVKSFLDSKGTEFSPSAFGSFCLYLRSCYNDVRDSRGNQK
jgi:hypothetical protein